MKITYLKNLLTDDVDVEELMLAHASLNSIKSECTIRGVDAPMWVSDKILAVNGAINDKIRAEIARKSRVLEAKYEALKPRSQVRSETLAELNRLRAQMGQPPMADPASDQVAP